ncbi:MAG: dTMP kinase [Bacillota bacterium]|jgi:dTMP kinase|nr:dTMP kinase [Bacillota bacterium]HOF65195.1 dTMP kinase [Bacilli bacterium]HPK86318.1 dTMP kinase [Bacilli bacterium]
MFITLEGPEGSGKTSVTKILIAELTKRGYDVLFTREPGGTPIAEQIRDIILDKKNTLLDARAEALLYAASRRQHLKEKVWPALEEGKIVICDRYLDSSLAYQGGARGLGVNEVLNINLFATEGSYPDLTLLFDVDPEIGLRRIKKNRSYEINRLDLEELTFHQKVRQTFLELSIKYKDRYRIIDASQELNCVANDALKIVLDKLENGC